MMASSKCYYSLRALLELSQTPEGKPVKIAEIAERQDIPVRFLEVILSQLKQAGFVRSQRGQEGGYMLAKPAFAITVGEVMRFVDGPVAPVDCAANPALSDCPTRPGCGMFDFWGRLRDAITSVVDQTTMQDLVEESRQKLNQNVPDWTI